MKPVALIVDDSELQRYVLRSALEEGYDVRAADSVAAALAALTFWGAPDLACIDWQLGDGDGGAICRALRQRDGGATATIVVISGSPDPDLRACAQKAGADAVLEKTGDLTALAAAIAALVRRRAGG
jgi:CheY-like chemotaxis protein